MVIMIFVRKVYVDGSSVRFMDQNEKSDAEL